MGYEVTKHICKKKMEGNEVIKHICKKKIKGNAVIKNISKEGTWWAMRSLNTICQGGNTWLLEAYIASKKPAADSYIVLDPDTHRSAYILVRGSEFKFIFPSRSGSSFRMRRQIQVFKTENKYFKSH